MIDMFCLGYTRASIRFNRPPGVALTLLVLSETTEALGIDHLGRVYASYKDPVVRS